MSERILVTGGAGFIGSNFIRYMLDKYADCRIINLDKLNYAGRRENLKDVEDNPRYRFVRGDICDEKVVAQLVKDCDTIVNFAAQTHVDRSIEDASEFVRTNVYGTYVLLEAARKCDNLRYIQISTDEVYGSRREGFFKEDDALNPSSPYSASKAGADLLTHSYFVTYNLPAVIVRSTNNFGPYQFPEKIIPLFITNALRDRRLPVYGKGENIRNWIYVLDNCRAIDLLMHKGEPGEIYNIAGTTEINNMELTRLILKIMGKSEELIDFVRDRPGHDWRYAIDCSKLRALGWKAQYNFEQALRETIQWYWSNSANFAGPVSGSPSVLAK
jgi:dTDP-glucose 4,6-dehydratase